MPQQALLLTSGQEQVTPEQEAEAKRFAAERVAAQLATAPVEEQEAERLLRQAYQVAALPAPRSIRWVDGPLQLIERLNRQGRRDELGGSLLEGARTRLWKTWKIKRSR